MTNKQIIIDGVDVSGCSYGEIEKSIFKCSCEYNVCSASMFCKDNPNCHYKQFKRKEQECEMWKNLTVDNGAVALKYQQQLDQLKAENDELKKEIAFGNNGTLSDKIRAEVFKELNNENKQLKAELEQEKNWHKTSDEISKVNSEYTAKLKQTLTEIKEIAESAPAIDTELSLRILEKISEVEDETNK